MVPGRHKCPVLGSPDKRGKGVYKLLSCLQTLCDFKLLYKLFETMLFVFSDELACALFHIVELAMFVITRVNINTEQKHLTLEEKVMLIMNE